MQVKESFRQFIRRLTDSKPKGITDEEWKVIRDEREAKKRKQAEFERYAIDHFEETPEYRSAGWLTRLRMKMRYRVWLDRRGEIWLLDGSPEMEKLLCAVDEETEALMKLSRDERIAYFRRMDRFNRMDFDMNFGTTVLHVRSCFEGKTEETVADTVKRVANTQS